MRWVSADYNYQSSVTTMLNDLKWPPLSERRKQFRLAIAKNVLATNCLLVNSVVYPSLPEHYFSTSRYSLIATRQHHLIIFFFT